MDQPILVGVMSQLPKWCVVCKKLQLAKCWSWRNVGFGDMSQLAKCCSWQNDVLFAKSWSWRNVVIGQMSQLAKWCVDCKKLQLAKCRSWPNVEVGEMSQLAKCQTSLNLQAGRELQNFSNFWKPILKFGKCCTLQCGRICQVKVAKLSKSSSKSCPIFAKSYPEVAKIKLWMKLPDTWQKWSNCDS